MLQNLQNIYSISRKYFITFDNKPALFSLVSLIATHVFKAFYGVSMNERIERAFDFLRTKRALAEFSTVFRDAVTRGYLPLIIIDLLISYLEKILTSACKTAIVQDLTDRWLKNDIALKNVYPQLSQDVPRILGEDSGKFAEKTIELFVEKAMSCVSLVSLFYRVYNLSKPLHHRSAPFPLNHPGGLCSLISGFTIVVCVVNFVVHRIMETSYNTARENNLLVTDLFSSHEKNIEQISSMPLSNKENIVRYVRTVFDRALRTSGDLKMGQLTGEFTWILPDAFELIIVYAGFLFMKANPEKFDYASFLPLIKASLSFIKKFNGAVQDIIKVLQGYASRINSVTKLLERFNQLDTLQSGIDFKTGKKLKVENLSVTGREKESVLEKVKLSMGGGEMVLVQGKSGAGKSVFAQVLCRNLFPKSQGTVITPQHVVRVSKMQFDPQPKTFSDLLKEKFGVEDPDLIQKIKKSLQKFSSYYPEGKWKFKALEDENQLDNWSTLSVGQGHVLNLTVSIESIMHNLKNQHVLLICDEILANLDKDVNLRFDEKKKTPKTPPNSNKKKRPTTPAPTSEALNIKLSKRMSKCFELVVSTRGAAIKYLQEFVNVTNENEHKICSALLIEHSSDGLVFEPDSEITTNQGRFKIYRLKS